MLLRELDHRTKNNFALLSSLLELQRRQENDASAKEALALAIRRLWSFSAIYRHLPVGQSPDDDIPAQPYLSQLIDSVSGAVFGEQVVVTTDIAEGSLPRQVAMAIALYINEALTNCAKHAFDPGQVGQVEVNFRQERDGWLLTIRDDGKGFAQGYVGSGSALMEAFARQANARHSREADGAGCSLTLKGKLHS